MSARQAKHAIIPLIFYCVLYSLYYGIEKLYGLIFLL